MANTHLLEDVVVPNEKQLKKLEELHYDNGASAEVITREICAHVGIKQMLKLLSQTDKKLETY